MRAHNRIAYVVTLALTLQTATSEIVINGTQSDEFLASYLTPEARQYSNASSTGRSSRRRKGGDIKIFVGIFTNPDPHQDSTPPSFAARRDVLRTTTLAGINRPGSPVVARFVLGQPPFPNETNSAPWEALRKEADQHQDFMSLPVPELELHKSRKAMLFFSQVLQQYPSVEFVVKAEDGAYLQPQRLLMAADQWAAMQADYIGCMGFSKVATHSRHPSDLSYAHLLSDEYPMRAFNPIYVLSRRGVESVARNAGRLRLLGGADDASVALWMLRIASKYFDDQRLCATSCRNNTVAVVSQRRREGLDAQHLADAAAEAECAAEAIWPLPYSNGDPELMQQRV